MSGICGIVMFGGAKPDRSEIEAMLEPLKRRGPDGANVWTGSGVAFGHALLATTLEALVEKLPLHLQASGCTITADVRLDNRDDLMTRLGVAQDGRVVGDGELILLAYLKWGEDCVHHLLGDFAFAVWDERRHRLYCARDPMGMRQLAYSDRPGRGFAFATEPAAVLCHPAVPKDLNPGRIADFLDNLEGADLTETFYAAVSRLPPAHRLTVTAEGLRIQRYWSLNTPPPLRLKSGGDYAEAFLDVFRASVRCRLRSPGRVGAMLSGGMDSSSIVAVAAELLAEEGKGPLATFSAVGPDPATCPETGAIHAATRIRGIQPHLISSADLESYRDELVRLTREEAEPFDGHMGLLRAVYLSAHRKGLKVMLDGVGGDLVLDSDSYVARLLRQGRVMRAWRTAQREHEVWGPAWPAWKVFGVGASRAWLPRRIRAMRRRAVWWWRDRRIGRDGLISSDFAAVARLKERRQQQRERNSSFDRLDKEERARRLDHAYLTVGRERYDRVASAVAIEPRDPFLDLRLIDFCLSLPWRQLQSGGWRKVLLRQAMAEKLPDVVRWRKGKEHLGPQFTAEIFGRLAANDRISELMCETIAPYVDLRRVGGSPAREHCNDWVDALCLYHWLEFATRSQEL